jgi:hypothetical protein
MATSDNVIFRATPDSTVQHALYTRYVLFRVKLLKRAAVAYLGHDNQSESDFA